MHPLIRELSWEDFSVQRQQTKNKIDTSYLVRRQIRIVDPRPQAELAKQNNEEKRHRRA